MMPAFDHLKRYDDPVNNCVSVKLLPGDYYVTTRDELITTVLGSCISACIYDPERGCGGMNHFMLPGDGGDRQNGLARNDACTRFGLHAMEGLINGVLKSGGRREHLRAKIFGGGRIIEQMTDVGLRNIAFARNYLELEGIPIEASDLGNIYPRKINFYPRTGKAMVKRLKSLHNDTIQVREAEYKQKLERSDAAGAVELF